MRERAREIARPPAPSARQDGAREAQAAPTSRAGRLLDIQRRAGNQAVQALLAHSPDGSPPDVIRRFSIDDTARVEQQVTDLIDQPPPAAEYALAATIKEVAAAKTQLFADNIDVLLKAACFLHFHADRLQGIVDQFKGAEDRYNAVRTVIKHVRDFCERSVATEDRWKNLSSQPGNLADFARFVWNETVTTWTSANDKARVELINMCYGHEKGYDTSFDDLQGHLLQKLIEGSTPKLQLLAEEWLKERSNTCVFTSSSLSESRTRHEQTAGYGLDRDQAERLEQVRRQWPRAAYWPDGYDKADRAKRTQYWVNLLAFVSNHEQMPWSQLQDRVSSEMADVIAGFDGVASAKDAPLYLSDIKKLQPDTESASEPETKPASATKTEAATVTGLTKVQSQALQTDYRLADKPDEGRAQWVMYVMRGQLKVDEKLIRLSDRALFVVRVKPPQANGEYQLEPV